MDAQETHHDDSEKEEEEEEEEVVVTYGTADVAAATKRVVALLRGWYRRHNVVNDGNDGAESGVGDDPTTRAELLLLDEPPPATRGGWAHQHHPSSTSFTSALGQLCRVDREVEPRAVVGVLHRTGLIRFLEPKTDEGDDDDGGGRGGNGDRSKSSNKEAAERPRKRPTSREHGGGQVMTDSEPRPDGEGVSTAMADGGGVVVVEWVAGEEDLTALEAALTSRFGLYGDAAIILARVLPWLKARLPRRSGRRKAQADRNLPQTLGGLVEVVRQQGWGAITHHVRPTDVVRTLFRT